MTSLVTACNSGWRAKELKMVPEVLPQPLAELMNKVENGAPWPQGTLHAKASFLPKDPASLADPMAYRILLILPTLYRHWAATRR